MVITWNGQPSPISPSLHSNPRPSKPRTKLHKRVQFTSSTYSPPHTSPPSDTLTLHPSALITPSSPPFSLPSGPPALPTSSPSPLPKRSRSLLSRFTRLRVSNPDPILDPPPRPASVASHSSDQSWHHHSSYFPEYTPIYPTTTFTPPTLYTLDPAEAQAAAHAARVGHAVVVHYPTLPSFDHFGKKDGANWRSGAAQWGAEGWTGYGWDGEKLPNAQGQTFGAPMPKGVAAPPGVINAPGAPGQAGGQGGGQGGGGGGKSKKKKKGKGGGGGGGGGGGDGGGDEGRGEGEGEGDGDGGGEE